MKVFDFERAIDIVYSSIDIFGEDWVTVERIGNFLRVGYKDIYLDFSCYKYI